MLPRLHLFEFTDLRWWPQPFRRLLTDFLRTYVELLDPFSIKMPDAIEALRSAKTDNIVDLCGGSGGPWRPLSKQVLATLGSGYTIHITDLYPQSLPQDLSHVSAINFVAEPIDARKVPATLPGARTLFDGLHHFRPTQAQSIIQDAINSREPIVVFELLNRAIPDLIPMVLAWIHVILLTPFIRPLRLSSLFWTYIVPIAPIVIAWDASVSTLRCYTPDELRAMVKSCDDHATYKWDIGRYKKYGILPVTYLIATPRDQA